MPTPIIDVTDLYHPHQDIGDNFDLIAAYALPDIDLRAVILDCTNEFRTCSADNPIGFGGFTDRTGPRDSGFIPVEQLNYIFDRDVPCAPGPFTQMRTPSDTMTDVPCFQQRGIELILKTLRESSEPVEILCFGSARTIASAYNREPDLCLAKVKLIRLSAGAASPHFLEWNTLLDPAAIVCLLRSPLPIAIYPDAADHAHGYGPHNTYYKLPNLQFVLDMDPKLRRYLEFAFHLVERNDFLCAMDSAKPLVPDNGRCDAEHHIWETALWINASKRQLVRRFDGSHGILPASDLLPTDSVLPNELMPCRVRVEESGRYAFTLTDEATNFSVYYRGDPCENERALQDALPALYRSFSL